MPIKNTQRIFDAPAYYHVYNRGSGKQPIFYDDADREVFLSLLDRYLDPNNMETRSDGRLYETYEVAVVAYCLMNNHFHLLLYQAAHPDAITQLMRSISTAYSMYFNRKYKHVGHLFESAYKASHVDSEAYLAHISRYIHMNPRSYLRYKWSSLAYYLGRQYPPVWLRPDSIHNMTPQQYRSFLEDYESKKAELELLKNQLAG